MVRVFTEADFGDLPFFRSPISIRGRVVRSLFRWSILICDPVAASLVCWHAGLSGRVGDGDEEVYLGK